MDLWRCVTFCTLYLFQNSFFKFSFLIVNYTRNRSTVWIPLSECRFVKYVVFCLSWYRYYNGRLWLTNVCRQGPSQFELECFFFRLCPYGWYFSAALYQRPSANKNKSVPVSFIFLFLFQLHKTSCGYKGVTQNMWIPIKSLPYKACNVVCTGRFAACLRCEMMGHKCENLKILWSCMIDLTFLTHCRSLIMWLGFLVPCALFHIF